MRFLRQFGLILLFSFLGELLHILLPLPVPASVYGLLLLLAALLTRIKEAAVFLIEIMPVMFIPAAVGLLTSWKLLQPIWFPVSVITLVTTVLVMAVTGRITQRMIRKNRKREKK